MNKPSFLKTVATASATLLALSACQVNLGIGIETDGSISTVFEFHDPESQLAAFDIASNCEELRDAIVDQLPAGSEEAELLVEDISTSNDFACRFTGEAERSPESAEILKETDDTFIFTSLDSSDAVSPSDLALIDSLVDFSLTVVMPGDIISAEGAVIEGNRATFTDLETFVEGITVEGKKEGSGSIEDIASDNSSSGMPIWAWVAITAGLVIAIGALVFFIVRKKPEVPPASTEYANTAIPTTDMPTAANQPYPGSAMPGAHGVPDGTTAAFNGSASPVAPNQPYPGVGVAGANGVPDHHVDDSENLPPEANDEDQLQ